jgi:hypothetical protein
MDTLQSNVKAWKRFQEQEAGDRRMSTLPAFAAAHANFSSSSSSGGSGSSTAAPAAVAATAVVALNSSTAAQPL